MPRFSRARSWLVLLGLGVCLSACQQECNRISSLLNKVQLVLEIVGIACGSVFLLVFVGGGVITLFKNERTPTARSKGWGLGLGILNVVFGMLSLVSFVLDAPQASTGGVEWESLLMLVALSFSWIAFGGAVAWIAQRAKLSPVR